MKQSWRRVVDLDSGTAMIVTDLHGNGDVYKRYRDRFLSLHAQGLADYLILSGDLIHLTGPAEEDASLDMVLNVLKLREALDQRIIYLLGNHELPHIYSITLQKGDYLFTPRFQKAMGKYREQILALFTELPFFVRTMAGVSICHAGASSALDQVENAKRLFDFSHEELLEQVHSLLSEEERHHLRQILGQRYRIPYDQLVRDYFDVNGPDDPRYDDFVVGSATASNHPDFELLWQMLFTRNELQYGSDYPAVLRIQLAALSTGYFQQNVLVSGHLDCQGGYTVVTDQQLRIASAKNAHPLETGRYLLLDLEQPVSGASEIVTGLGTVFN
jgi:hypothetical protein